MKIVESYRSNDGQLHRDKLRAAASDLHHALPSSSVNPNAKVFDWAQCFRIFENLDVVKKAIADYEAMGDIQTLGPQLPGMPAHELPPMPPKK